MKLSTLVLLGGAAYLLFGRKGGAAAISPGVAITPVGTVDLALCAKWKAYSEAAANPDLAVAAWVGPIPQGCPGPGPQIPLPQDWPEILRNQPQIFVADCTKGPC